MLQERYMWRAIDLASRAEWQSVNPNPPVGAVLVYQDRIIGEGYHQLAGEAHAEVHCLNSVEEQDKSLIPMSTLYVTLEPCAHEGRTPSCAKRLAKEQVKKVVVGALDPNPLTAGKGVEILRNAGVEVRVGLLAEECRHVARVFFTNQLHHRPYITLKWAESLDGYIDSRGGDREDLPTKLSSPFTQLLVHRLRSQYSVILVGSNTFSLDRPQLNNRLWLPSPYSPRPILLSSRKVALPPHWLQLHEVSPLALQKLYTEEGITSLLVEGGTLTHHSFLEQGLWDEVRREIAPIRLQTGTPAPTLPTQVHLVQTDTFPKGHHLQWYHLSQTD